MAVAFAVTPQHYQLLGTLRTTAQQSVPYMNGCSNIPSRHNTKIAIPVLDYYYKSGWILAIIIIEENINNPNIIPQ
jgi:hypothetical protein